LTAFLGAFAKLQKATICFVMSICLPAWNIWAPTGQIFMKLDVWVFFEDLLREFKFNRNRTNINGILRESQYTFLIISISVLPRIRNVSDKRCRENENMFYVQKLLIFLKIMPFNRLCGKYCRSRQVTDDKMAHAHCMLHA